MKKIKTNLKGIISCYCDARDKGLIFGEDGIKYVFDSSCIKKEQIPKRHLVINQKCFVKFKPDIFYNNQVAKDIEYVNILNKEKELFSPLIKESEIL